MEEVNLYLSLTDIKIILIGNKCDQINRVVTFEEGKALAAQLDIGFMETSAKQNINIEDAFYSLIQGLVQERLASRLPPEEQQIPKKGRSRQKRHKKFRLHFQTCNLI